MQGQGPFSGLSPANDMSVKHVASVRAFTHYFLSRYFPFGIVIIEAVVLQI